MTPTSSYPTLLDALRDISSTEQTARTHDRERRKVDTYWHMGDAIHTHVRELMDGVREDLFQRYRKVGWSALEEEAPSDLPPLQPLCGQLFTYRLMPTGEELGELALLSALLR
jgi:hypothetical protein